MGNLYLTMKQRDKLKEMGRDYPDPVSLGRFAGSLIRVNLARRISEKGVQPAVHELTAEGVKYLREKEGLHLQGPADEDKDDLKARITDLHFNAPVCDVCARKAGGSPHPGAQVTMWLDICELCGAYCQVCGKRDYTWNTVQAQRNS